MALKLDILANTRQLVSEMRKGGASVEDISDALDDLARDAKISGDKTERAIDDIGDAGTDAARDLDRAGDKMERAIDDIGDAGKDAARDVDTATEKMERSFRDLVKDAKKADDAVEKVGDSGKKGFKVASEAGAEFKDEALSNFSEVTSSFDGSMSSIQDLAQGTLGGLASTGLPGIGIAAGIAAIGVGTIGAAIEANDEKMQASEERIGEWTQAYLDGSGKVVSAAHVVGAIQEIATDPERYKEATQAAKDWSVDIETAMLAMAGDATALGTVQDALKRKTEEYKESVEGVIQQGDGYAASTGYLTAEQKALRDEIARGNQILGKQNDEMTEAQRRASNAESALFNYAKTAGVATGKTDDLGNAIYKLPDETEVVVDARTGKAYQDLDAIERKTKRLPDGTIRLTVDDRAVRNYVPPAKTMRLNVLPTRGRQIL